MNTVQELMKLVTTNKEKYYRVAFAYVKNREDALDIVHNAIVKAIQKCGFLRKKEYLETWFYRILINESIAHIRKRDKILYFDESIMSQIEDEDSILDKIIYMNLYSAVDKLSPELKTVIILRFFESMKICDIADITSTNLNTTKARLYKALKILKTYMEE
ncbi:MAG: sigma-70 family RNA polymerase sigma factor [Coprobacillus sp.]